VGSILPYGREKPDIITTTGPATGSREGLPDPTMAGRVASQPAPGPSVAPSLTQAIPAPKRFFGRATETAVGAAPMLALSPGSAVLRAVSALGTGLGSETAGTAAEAMGFKGAAPYARLVGGLVGGVAPSVVSTGLRLAELRGQLPTRQQYREAADSGYRFLEVSDTRLSEAGTQSLVNDLRTGLRADRFTTRSADRVYGEIDDFAGRHPVGSGPVSIADIDDLRRILGDVKPTAADSNFAAARRAVRGIDEWLGEVPDRFVISGDAARDAAVLRQAQQDWSLHRQLGLIEDAMTSVHRRAGATERNAINASREAIRQIIDSERKSRGLSEAVRERMETIVMGTWLTNRARWLAKFAPTSPVTALISGLTGYGIGIGEGAAVAVGGLFAKYLGRYLTDRQIAQLQEFMSAQGRLGGAVAREIVPQMAQERMAPLATAGAVLGATGASPLAPSQ
jgi:hypothetical protein